MDKKPSPVFEALRRRNIQGAGWRHVDAEGNVNYSLSITRSTKDTEGKWKNEKLYFQVEDAPRIRSVLTELENQAYEEMQADYDQAKNVSA